MNKGSFNNQNKLFIIKINLLQGSIGKQSVNFQTTSVYVQLWISGLHSCVDIYKIAQLLPAQKFRSFNNNWATAWRMSSHFQNGSNS